MRDPVETLREAANLMRQRAEKATPRPWTAKLIRHAEWVGEADFMELIGRFQRRSVPLSTIIAKFEDYEGNEDAVQADADHIASWHPAVALAVADWLDDIRFRAYGIGLPVARYVEIQHALAVASAYLGEPPDA